MKGRHFFPISKLRGISISSYLRRSFPFGNFWPSHQLQNEADDGDEDWTKSTVRIISYIKPVQVHYRPTCPISYKFWIFTVLHFFAGTLREMSSIIGCRKCQTERARISTRDDHHENSGLLKFEVDGDMKGQIVAKERKKNTVFLLWMNLALTCQRMST